MLWPGRTQHELQCWSVGPWASVWAGRPEPGMGCQAAGADWYLRGGENEGTTLHLELRVWSGTKKEGLDETQKMKRTLHEAKPGQAWSCSQRKAEWESHLWLECEAWMDS